MPSADAIIAVYQRQQQQQQQQQKKPAPNIDLLAPSTREMYRDQYNRVYSQPEVRKSVYPHSTQTYPEPVKNPNFNTRFSKPEISQPSPNIDIQAPSTQELFWKNTHFKPPRSPEPEYRRMGFIEPPYPAGGLLLPRYTTPKQFDQIEPARREQILQLWRQVEDYPQEVKEYNKLIKRYIEEGKIAEKDNKLIWLGDEQEFKQLNERYKELEKKREIYEQFEPVEYELRKPKHKQNDEQNAEKYKWNPETLSWESVDESLWEKLKKLFIEPEDILGDIEETQGKANIELQKIQDETAPFSLERFTRAAPHLALLFGAGAISVPVSMMYAGKRIVESPVEGTKEAVTGTIGWFTSAPKRVWYSFTTGNPVPAMTLAGEIFGGHAVGKVAAKTVGGPYGKLQAEIWKRQKGYIPIEKTGIEFLEDFTYKFAPAEELVRRFGGKEVEAIHVTEHGAFYQPTGTKMLLRAIPEGADWRRRVIKSFGHYVSLPKENFKPLAYLRYTRAGAREGSGKIKFAMKQYPITANIYKAKLRYFEPLPGETPIEYNLRIFENPATLTLPAENIYFGPEWARYYRPEWQAIFTTAFEYGGKEFPGTEIVKVGERGHTIYKRTRPLPLVENTFLGDFLRKLGYGEEYHKILLQEWEIRPPSEITGSTKITDAKGLREKIGEKLGRKEKVKELDLGKYAEEYGAEYVTPKDILAELPIAAGLTETEWSERPKRVKETPKPAETPYLEEVLRYPGETEIVESARRSELLRSPEKSRASERVELPNLPESEILHEEPRYPKVSEIEFVETPESIDYSKTEVPVPVDELDEIIEIPEPEYPEYRELEEYISEIEFPPSILETPPVLPPLEIHPRDWDFPGLWGREPRYPDWWKYRELVHPIATPLQLLGLESRGVKGVRNARRKKGRKKKS